MAEQLDLFGDAVKVVAAEGGSSKNRRSAAVSTKLKRHLALEIPAKAAADIEAIRERDGLKTDSAAVVAALASYAGRQRRS